MSIYLDKKELADRDQVEQASFGAFRNLAPKSGYWTSTDGITTDSKYKPVIAKHRFWRNASAPLLKVLNDTNHNPVTKMISIKFPRFNITAGQKYSLNIAAFEAAQTNLNSIKFKGRASDSSNDYDQIIEIVENTKFSSAEVEFKRFTFEIPNEIDNGYIQIDTGTDVSSYPSIAFFIAYFSVIQGDVVTHEWTPAVEDMATKAELDSLISRVSALENKNGGVAKPCYIALYSNYATPEMEVV